MALQSKNNLNGGINLDADALRLPANTAQFIKNISLSANINANAAALAGGNQWVAQPMEGSVALSISGMPAGTNYCIGFYSSEQSNEGYYAIFNSNNDHSIWVIRGNTGVVQKVHQSQLLPFILNPQYFYSEGRMTLEERSIIDPVTKAESNFKFIVFTNNRVLQCMIEVESSIATNSFTTSYFTSSAAFYDTLTLISLGVPLPIKCLKLNDPNPYVPVTSDTTIDTAIIDTQGTGYAVGDTFNINGTGTGGTGKVTTVGVGGAVTTIIVTNGGTGYNVATGVGTTATSGAGTGLRVDILTLVIPDSSKQNLLINEGWQFRVRTWDVFGRPSEWGIISSVFTVLIGGGCITTSNGLKRCVNLCFDSGNPLVKFIDIAYRRGVGNDPSGQTETGWFEHDTIRKYDDSAPVEWYQRSINSNFSTAGSGMTFDATTNIITYTFCADKKSDPVDPTETARTEPGIARWSSGVASINKKILLANNVYDFEPISQDVVDNVQFSVKPPTLSSCPAAPLRTITVYAAVYDPVAVLAGEHRQGFIRRSFGTWGFGRSSGGCGSYSFFAVDQVFGDQTNPGFIGVLRGTNFNTVAKQGDFDPATGIFNIVPLTSPAFPHGAMQQFVFTNVPAGKYIMQIASHKSVSTDSDIQKTSTYVGGLATINDLNTPTGLNAYASNPLKEIEIDCSAGDVILNGYQPGQSPSTTPVFVILDMVINSLAFGNGSAVIDGYLYERNGEDNPIEMNPVYFNGATVGAQGDCFGSFFTDHNGFYFGATDFHDLYLYIYADVCDGQGAFQRFIYGPSDSYSTYIHQGVGGITHGDGTGTGSGCAGVHGNWKNKVFLYPTTLAYPDAARRRIKQNVNLCSDHSVGVPGVPVLMTKVGPFQVTGSDGQAMLIAHNRYNYLSSIGSRVPPWLSSSIPDYSTSPNNQDKIIFSQKGGCEWNACGGCDTFMADAIVTYLGCGAPSSGCTTTQPARTLCLADVFANPNGIGIFGIQSGGKYPVAFWVHDFIGRHTAPQIKGGNLGYVYVPNLNDTQPPPYPNMSLCALQVTIPVGLTIDPVFKKITFLVGSNCLFRDYFSWAADWVQFVDNTGFTNPTNPTAVRIYFQSLNEYNKQYNFGTNVGWDFITGQQDPSQPRDVVQFIVNGNGTFLSPQKGAEITYSKDGSFFTFDYIPEFATLQNGCLFRVVRPLQNTTGTNLPYYEQCLTLDINNGLLPAGTYTIPYQDSYLLSRAIPVPIMKGETGLITPGSPAPGIQYTSTDSTIVPQADYATNNIANYNQVVIFQTKDAPGVFPFFFESPSPSDLWGSHLASKGRVGIVNPYEAQYRVGTEIALSNPLADKGIVNGIGTFLEINRQIFDRNTYGDITVALVEQGVCMVICNNDYFTTIFNQTQLEINEEGQVLGNNQTGPFTSPKQKIGSNYGCVMQNINTIQRFNGVVVFLDNKGHLVFSNFTDAKPTEKDGYLGYLLNKISKVNMFNLDQITNGKTYFIGGIDPKTMEYNLSSFNIPASGSPSYINTQPQPNLLVNETLIFDLETAILKSFASYTPEYYARIPGYYLQRQFLTFKNGIPYIQHNNFSNSVPPPAYCNFFGVQCEVRVTHVINGVDQKMLPDKVKRYFWEEVYCRQSIPSGAGVMPSALFYADVINSEKNQTSRLLVARWTLKDGYQTAAFICASNTPPDPNNVPATTTHAILDGDPLQGRWLQVSLTNNPLWTGTYFEVSELASYINGVEKSAD